MGDIQAGQNINVFLISGMTIFFCILVHFVYKISLRKKKNEPLKHEKEIETGPLVEDANSETPVTETRVGGKSKKRAPWKGKSEFSHPWLLKNLKGHPGTVLLVDFSANGKFMAATCDEQCEHTRGRQAVLKHQKTSLKEPATKKFNDKTFISVAQQYDIPYKTIHRKNRRNG